MMADPLIMVKDLVKKYDHRDPVLNGVSFAISEKEFVTISGKSGCGKTTLLNIIGGLDRPTSGSVVLDGIEIEALSENELAKLRLKTIGFVFQDYNLLPELSVLENVSLPLGLAGKKNGERAERLIEKFGLGSIARETANRLSGGEAQRAAIARAMANEPRIILADEPTGNLDEENSENVIDTFEIARKDFGTTIVLATHDPELARFATKKIRLISGRVEEKGL